MGLVKEDAYCLNNIRLNPSQNISLKECGEIVSKGEDGCQSTNITFMHEGHEGQDLGNCYCSTDDCSRTSSSPTDLNIYKLSEGNKLH